MNGLSVGLLLAAVLLTLPRVGYAETPVASGDLDVECSVPGYSIMPAFVGVDLTLEHAGKMLVEKNDNAGNFELAFLTSNCGLETFLPAGTTHRPMAFMSVTAQGDVLYDSGLGSTSKLVKQAGKAPAPLAPPADLGDRHWEVTLSDDGTSVVWRERRRLDGDESVELLRVRDLATGKETSIPLQGKSAIGFEVFSANVTEDEYVLRDYPNKVLAVDGHGAVKWGPKEATGVKSIVTSADFRRVGDGWVAWNGTADDGAAHLAWSTGTGSGHKEFPLSDPESVSVSPDGSRIAISVSSGSRLNDKEAVVILRVSDGAELFHRTLPLYSRVKLGFIDDTHLAMNTGGGVSVVRVPASLVPLDASEIPKPVDVEAQKLKYIGQAATMFRLELEKPKPDSKTALVGTWKLADVGPVKGCGMDEPFIEVHDDGVAYRPRSRSRMGTIEVGESYIRIAEPDSDDTLEIYAMSGGYYVPSHECMLLKLERVP